MDNDDTLGEILMELDFNNIMVLMRSNKRIYDYVLNNKVFWINKITQDFPFVPPLLETPYYKTYATVMNISTKARELLMNNIYFNIDDCDQLEVILPQHIIINGECNLVMNLGLSYHNSLNKLFYPAFISYGDYDYVLTDDEVILIVMKLMYHYPNTQIFTH